MTQEYQAYLLRFQREQNQVQWRSALQDVQTDEVQRFASERELIRYLLHKLTESTTVNRNKSEPDNYKKKLFRVRSLLTWQDWFNL